MPESPAERLARLEAENVQLRRAVEELGVLNKLAVEIAALDSTDEIIHIITRRALPAVGAEQGVITLVGDDVGETGGTLVRERATAAYDGAFHLDVALRNWMHEQRRPLIANTPRDDERLRGVTLDPAVRTLLAVPLSVKGQLRAILVLYNKGGTGFDEDDARLAAIIAGQSAQALENTRLAEQERQLLLVRQQVRIAASIQQQLLPREAPRVAGYEIAGNSLAALEVGGDYYDFVELDETRIAVCLGDVSGKGLPASLLMANLQGTIRAHARPGRTPGECVEQANRMLCASTDPARFVTFVYAELDHARHRVTVCNAGHNPPLHALGGSELVKIPPGGPVLGVLPAATYAETIVDLAPGDLLVLYSDGVTEAAGDGDEEFGETRLEAVVDRCRSMSAAATLDAVLEAVRAFAGGRDQADDITVTVVRRAPA